MEELAICSWLPTERSWEKTKNDDSEIEGEKNLVEMTRDSYEGRYYVIVFFFSISLSSFSLPYTFYGLTF